MKMVDAMRCVFHRVGFAHAPHLFSSGILIKLYLSFLFSVFFFSEVVDLPLTCSV